MSALDDMLAEMHARDQAACNPGPLSDADPIAPIGPFSYVRGTRGGPKDVPVESYRYVHRDATAKRPERSYVKPIEGPVDTAAYVEANRGIVQKGTPAARKRIPFERRYTGSGTALGKGKGFTHDPLTLENVESLLVLSEADYVPAWLKCLMGETWIPRIGPYAPRRAEVARLKPGVYHEDRELKVLEARKEARTKMLARNPR